MLTKCLPSVKDYYDSRNYGIDNADKAYGEDDSLISYYLDSILVALKPVKIWTLPGASKGGKVIKTIPVGSTVGKLDSWVMDKNGKDIWIILVDAAGKKIGYTPFLTGYFDRQIAAQTSSGKAFIEKQKALDNAPLFNTDSLNNIFGDLKTVALLFVIVMIVALFYRVSGK